MSPKHLYFWRCHLWWHSIFGDGGSFDRHQWAYGDIFWRSPMSFFLVVMWAQSIITWERSLQNISSSQYIIFQKIRSHIFSQNHLARSNLLSSEMNSVSFVTYLWIKGGNARWSKIHKLYFNYLEYNIKLSRIFN